MKKGIKLFVMVFVISFLTSCASSSLVIPNTNPEADKTFTTSQEGTVEILGQDMKIKPKHWMFVRCEHWSGCFLRCQGDLNSCKKVAKDYKLKLDYVDTNH